MIGTAFLVGSSMLTTPYAYGNAGGIDSTTAVTTTQASVGYTPTNEKPSVEQETYKIKSGINYFSIANKVETSNPRIFDRSKLSKATPEYQEIERERINKGTGKYWGLLEGASNRVKKVLEEYIVETGVDILIEYKEDENDNSNSLKQSVDARKYLEIPENIDVQIEDVTEQLTKMIEESSKDAKSQRKNF